MVRTAHQTGSSGPPVDVSNCVSCRQLHWAKKLKKLRAAALSSRLTVRTRLTATAGP